jgi:hypothetical protein
MTTIAKIVEIAFLAARTWHSNDEAEVEANARLVEPLLEPLDGMERALVLFACKMLAAEKPLGIKARGTIDPRFYEIAELLGAHALPCLEWADDIVSTYFIPPGVDIPTGEAA